MPVPSSSSLSLLQSPLASPQCRSTLRKLAGAFNSLGENRWFLIDIWSVTSPPSPDGASAHCARPRCIVPDDLSWEFKLSRGVASPVTLAVRNLDPTPEWLISRLRAVTSSLTPAASSWPALAVPHAAADTAANPPCSSPCAKLRRAAKNDRL